MVRNLKAQLILAMALVVALSLAGPAAALAEDAPPPPAIAAKSVLMINPESGKVLYSQNPDERLPMASTTKMMTALIIFEETEDLALPVTVSENAATVGESSVWLNAGEQLTVEELLKGTLIQSGNDAATALAEYNAGSVAAFVDKMNARAAELGMANTHFTNPHGLDDPEHFTTASDYIALALEFRKHDKLMEIVGCADATISSNGAPDGRLLINHNHFLELFPVVNGIKTGFTDAAGQCIVVSAEQDGVNLLLAYLGASSYAQRNDEVIKLVNYGLSLYRQETIIEQGGVYAGVGIPYSDDDSLALVAEEGRSGPIFHDNDIEYRLIVPDEVVPPVKKGDKVGLVSAYEEGNFLGSTYLIATEDVDEVSWTGKVGYYLGSVFGFISVTSMAAMREVFSA